MPRFPPGDLPYPGIKPTSLMSLALAVIFTTRATWDALTKKNKISQTLGASLKAQTVKNLPAVQETWVRSLGREDPLEKGMATHSSILAWRIPMDRGAWQATVHGIAKSGT